MNPPRWAERLLELSLPAGLTGASIIGDMSEDFDARVASHGLRAARRWYVRHALGLTASFLWRDLLRVFSPGGSTMVHLVRESVRSALRSVRRAPAFTATTVVILALGIGATAAVFSIVDGVLIRPLAYPDADELYSVHYGWEDNVIPVLSEPEYLDVSREVTAFDAVAAYVWGELALGAAAGEPERIPILRTTASLGPLLGVELAAGRWFTAEEDGPVAQPVALLSSESAVQLFGRAVDAVGRDVVLDDRPHTVVGVLSPGVSFASEEVRAWLPLGLDPADPFGRNNHYLEIVARLSDDATVDVARSQLAVLATTSRAEYPDFYDSEISFLPLPLKDRVVGSARAPLILLLGAVASLLLVAATNAAGLFLARGERRRSEVAVRTALGASRSRIILHLLAEAVLVSLLAAIAGLGLAHLAVESVGGWASQSLPRLSEVAVDGRVILFGVMVALTTGVTFGLLPALQAGRGDVRGALSVGGRGGLGSRRDARFRRGLVVGQLALASVLVLGSTLLVRSLSSLRDVDLGMDLTSTIIIPVLPTENAVPRDAPAVRFYEEMESRIAALPGVRSVGAARRVPLANGYDRLSIQVDGRPPADLATAPVAGIQWATAGYFDAARIPVLEGRSYTPADDIRSPLVAVVNEALAAELWPGVPAVGQRVRMYREGSPWMEIVGVVADVRRNGPQEEAPSMLYIPHAQAMLSGYLSPNDMSLFVGLTGTDPGTVPAIRSLIRELAPTVPLGTMRSGDELTEIALARDRFLVTLFAAFSFAALLLGSVGVYGVISQTVRSRTREMGLRVAMGASSRAIGAEVLRDGIRVGLLGGVIGLAGGLVLSSRVSASVLHVSPLDPVAYLLVIPTLVAIAVAATLLPALSAARMDPVRALHDTV